MLKRLSDFFFLLAGLLPNSPLLLIHVNNDLILHVELVPLHILLGDQQVCSFFVVEFLYQLVICLVEVFSSFNLVYFAWLFKFLRVLLLWLDALVICIDKVLMLVKFLKDLLVARSTSHVEPHTWGGLMSFVSAPLWVSVLVNVSKIVIFKIVFWV